MSDVKDVLDGFNCGYIIRNRKPELYKQLVQQVDEVDLPFFTSFKDGGKEYEKELIKGLMNRGHQFNSSNKTLDKDNIELDMDI